MVKIEQGNGKLLSVDTDKKVLRFQEILMVSVEGMSPKEWELPYVLDWEDKRFFDLVGKSVKYVLSDSAVVDLKLG